VSSVVEWLLEPFTYAFLRNALAAGLLTVVAGSLVGTWVVLRGLAFLGDALAHGILPGIAIAYLVGGDLLVGAALGALVMVGGVSFVSARARVGEDTAIGLLFVGMLALGVAIISRRGAYAGDLAAILFGDPLAVRPSDVRVIAVATLVALVAVVVAYRPFLTLTYARDKALVLGMRPGAAHLGMLVLIALVVVASFRTVGTLLVFAFLVAPPATAALLVRRVPAIMAVSVAVGSASVLAGLIASYRLGLAAAPTIAGLTVLVFLATLAVRDLVRTASARLARAA
jgi:ABC-type Mn2+/Zn2+ transport system permease subunit